MLMWPHPSRRNHCRSRRNHRAPCPDQPDSPPSLAPRQTTDDGGPGRPVLLDTGRGLVLDVRGGRPAEIELMRDALGLRAPGGGGPVDLDKLRRRSGSLAMGGGAGIWPKGGGGSEEGRQLCVL
jgi:hypothetical protein